jgi:alpha-amylase
MINFEFKSDAQKEYSFMFQKYSDLLNNQLKGYSVLNYLSSHDDGSPFDANRTKSIESGTKLLLTPGISQIYYGDESARSLVVEGTQGDATLRSFMNWDAITTNKTTQQVLTHWRKLGQFRSNHPSVGAGVNVEIATKPYVCSRTLTKGNYTDTVVIALDLAKGKKEIPVGSAFKEGTKLRDGYSGKLVTVLNGKVIIDSEFDVVLLELKK